MKDLLRPVTLFAVILLALAIGCAPVKTQELIGSYRGKLPAGEEILELLPSGDCVQEIHLKDGKTYSARGHWRYDMKNRYLHLDGTRIPLNGFGEMNPDIARVPEGGTGSLPIKKRLFGGIEIGASEDVMLRKMRDKEPEKR